MAERSCFASGSKRATSWSMPRVRRGASAEPAGAGQPQRRSRRKSPPACREPARLVRAGRPSDAPTRWRSPGQARCPWPGSARGGSAALRPASSWARASAAIDHRQADDYRRPRPRTASRSRRPCIERILRSGCAAQWRRRRRRRAADRRVWSGDVELEPIAASRAGAGSRRPPAPPPAPDRLFAAARSRLRRERAGAASRQAARAPRAASILAAAAAGAGRQLELEPLRLRQRAGDRRAQLVGAVCGELALGFERSAQPLQQPVDGRDDREKLGGNVFVRSGARLAPSRRSIWRRSPVSGAMARPMMSQIAEALPERAKQRSGRAPRVSRAPLPVCSPTDRQSAGACRLLTPG